jgi:hypothetical protein
MLQQSACVGDIYKKNNSENFVVDWVVFVFKLFWRRLNYS